MFKLDQISKTRSERYETVMVVLSAVLRMALVTHPGVGHFPSPLAALLSTRHSGHAWNLLNLAKTQNSTTPVQQQQKQRDIYVSERRMRVTGICWRSAALHEPVRGSATPSTLTTPRW